MPFAAAAAVAWTAGCKEAADPAKVAEIAGLNPVDSVRAGRTFALSYELRDADGNRLTGRTVTWTSLNTSIATVDNSGVVTGIQPGTSLVTARADNVTASTLMKVQAAATSLVLQPASVNVPVGASRTLNVALLDQEGQTIGGRLINFSSSVPSVATVNASGVVVGVTTGSTTITATAVLDNVSGTATVNVVPVSVASIAITPAGAQTVFQGLTLQLAATTRDGDGNILTGRPVSWTSSNTSVATVSGNGLVSGLALGSAQITAESEGKIAVSNVTVAPRPVATVALSPNPATVAVGQFVQLSLDLRDANGNALTTTGRSVTWASSNNPVATVQDGVVKGVTPGTATITVTVDGKSASVIVSVTPA